ncbi:hypothetical protein ACE1OC_41565 (plasmid) [Streptomyces sp. DSM 116496]|uniref:hypothetical protein n=1 Tax=Streptomyces stoeckheimensis TaxID=3344656 RepID=UPI0038B2BD3F
MAGLSESLMASVGMRLAQLELQLEHAQRAHELNAKDQREWARTILRSLSDIAQDADQMAVILTANAVHHKVLTPTEAAEAALISRNAVYKRVAAHFDPEA